MADEIKSGLLKEVKELLVEADAIIKRLQIDQMRPSSLWTLSEAPRIYPPTEERKKDIDRLKAIAIRLAEIYNHPDYPLKIKREAKKPGD